MSNENFIVPACSNTTMDFSSVIMRWMDLPKATKIQKCLLLENLMPGAVAHIIEDAAKVLHTKFESSGTSTFVATEG